MGAEQRAANTAVSIDGRASIRIGSERGEISARKLAAIAGRERYRELGPFRIIVVGNAGFIAERINAPQVQAPDSERRTALLDFDDVTGATTAIKDASGGTVDGKPTFFVRSKEYIEKLGISLSDELLRRVIKQTDDFSRWQDVDGGGDIYHQGAHASSFEWAIQQLQGKAKSQITPTVDAIGNTLARIKSGETIHSQDPFYFRRSDRQLVMRSIVPWSRGMGDMFMDTLITPPYYPEVVETTRRFGRGRDTMDGISFTAGDPLRQFPKYLEYLLANPDASMRAVWLTQVEKGDFVREVDRLGLLRGSYVLFDDSIHQIISAMAASDRIAGVLSRRPDTREGKKALPEEPLPFPVIDFGASSVSAEQIGQTLRTAISTIQTRRMGARSVFDRVA